MRFPFVFLFLLTAFFARSQQPLKGLVLDSASRQPLPFATVQIAEGKTLIAAIDGRFVVRTNGALKISYSGHRSKTVSATDLGANDTVLLSPLANTMQEVVVRSQSEKVRRIVNTAVQNKPLNNPDKYAAYECRIYYKMIVDVVPYGPYNRDSLKREADSLAAAWARKRGKDTAKPASPFALPSHLFVTESYSKRLCKRPAQTQEIVLASRVSGLKKTYFANLVTDVLPFHAYGDYIALNGVDFLNPIAKGWQGRYRFLLEDEVLRDEDTLFILSYRPKAGASFNALTGLVYISSQGYALTHITGSNRVNDSASRLVKFEHIYGRVNGRWFPQELNYDFAIPRVPEVYTQVRLNGHSLIDSALFDQGLSEKFDKAHSLKLAPTVDGHSDEDWVRYRRDTLSIQERNTYRNLDSLAKEMHVETLLRFGARIAEGRFPVGVLDVELRRLITANEYEGTRLGLGLYTNNKISRHFSVGGWWGYGFKDKAAKWGASLALFPKGQKENWVQASFQKSYRLTGEVALHPELMQTALRAWLLQVVDETKEYALTANLRAGYWELRPSVVRTEVGPLHYAFLPAGKNLTSFVTNEAALGFRYAYGEKRTPFFETWFSQSTPYPVVYANLSCGRLLMEGADAGYTRLLTAVAFAKHINRWGADRYRLEGGAVFGGDALPRSLLLAGNGLRRGDLNFYSFGGLLTVRPFDFYSDRYLGFFYKHDFDKNFWDTKWSKPYPGLAHNLVYGGLREANKVANPGLQGFERGYHETGLLINRLLRYNLGFADAALNLGAFYHWQGGGSWKQNAVWVVGIETGF